MTGLPPGSRPEQRILVLVCDPDPALRRQMRAALGRRETLHVVEVDRLQDAEAVIPRCAAALLSVNGPAEDAVSRLRAGGFFGTLVVALAGASVADAVAAMRAGADDVVLKPLQPEDVVDRLLAGTPARRADRRRATGRAPLPRGGDFCGFLGRSEPMVALYAQINRVAASRAPVFVTGESGTGKDMAAQAVHAVSPRRDGAFQALKISAIARAGMEADLFGQVRGATGANADRPGAAERADGGTLFLDEICDLDPALQAKLLHFLETGRLARVGAHEERAADVRIVCATTRDPVAEVRAGRLREDLFYRLHVLNLHMPPLRERGEDVILLAEAFLARCAGEEGRPLPRLGPEAAAALRARSFRGNVRELQNLMRRAVIQGEGPAVVPDMLAETESAHPGGEESAPRPPQTSGPGWFGTAAGWAGPARVEPLSVVERRAIEAAIAAFDGNISLAAAALDLSPSTLYRKKQAWESNRRLS
ncbi:sigma-54-dependent transcriptional regulator [Xanthobacter sp. AM11]|uniref:sigma-54-dependent transcriptional regulator n=1 Tax=Xanthobacter sp. AM11 TaxID=3380643 RepID=UPI0039BF7B3A